MGEWLAKLGASWGTGVALIAGLVLVANGIRRVVRIFTRRRSHRDDMHVEEFRRAVDELLAEFERAAIAIESRIAAQFDHLAEAERRIDEKRRQMTLAHVGSECSEEMTSEPPVPAAAPHQPPPVEFTISTQSQLAIPAGPAPPFRESRSRRIGRYAKSTPDQFQTDLLARIRQMADDGSSPAAIAEALHIPLGDVETYLSLRQLVR